MIPAFPLAVLLSIATPAAAQDGEAAVAAMVGDRRPRAPVDCIDPHDVRSTVIVPAVGLVYDAGRRVYVNRPLGGARFLRRDDTLATRVEGGQLCRVDTVALLDPVTRMQRGVLVLGPFTPYERPR